MERRIEAETKLLAQQGHQVFVATPHFPKLSQWQRDIRSAGGKYIYWRPYKFIERQHLAPPFRWLARLGVLMLRYYRIEFAHLALPWNFFGISLAYVLSAAKIPFVMAAHCKFDSKTLPPAALPLAKQALHSLRGVYAVSTPVKDAFLWLYQDLIPPGTPVEVIHNGIDTDRYRPDAAVRQALRERLSFTEEHFVALFCGRLDANKRPQFALHLFVELLVSHPQARLLVVGDGPEMTSLKAAIQGLKLQGKVILTGQVTDTAPYYQASDCYISCSSQIEGCPLATAEALASGIPAIVPDDDVFRSVYGASSAVQLCNPTDPAPWRQALLSLARQNAADRAALSEAARKFAEENLSVDIMNQKLAAFYEKVISLGQASTKPMA
jgi:glycosyltransferase involved in cell wall biosynthesis